MTDDDVHQSNAMIPAQQDRQEDLQRGPQETFLEILEIRFGPVPENLKRDVFAVSEETERRELLRPAIPISSFEEFREVF